VSSAKSKKTAKRQARRKVQGNIAENLVKKDLKKKMPSHFKLSINRNAGIDIFATNKSIYNVEVKSAKEKTLQKYGNVHRPRVGTFQIKPDDYLQSDFFGFVIKEVDKKTKVTGKNRIQYVNSKNIRKFAKQKDKLSKPIKISIHQLKKIPKMRLGAKKW